MKRPSALDYLIFKLFRWWWKPKFKALIGLSLLTALTVVLGGCGWISDAGVKEAIAVCAPHGGLKSVHPRKWDTSPEYEAECKDGKSIIGRAKDAA